MNSRLSAPDNPVDVLLSPENVDAVVKVINSWVQSTLKQNSTVSPAWVYEEIRQRCYDMYGNMSFYNAPCPAEGTISAITERIRQQAIESMKNQIFSQYSRASLYHEALTNGRPAITDLPMVFPDMIRQRQLPGFKDFKRPKF